MFYLSYEYLVLNISKQHRKRKNCFIHIAKELCLKKGVWRFRCEGYVAWTVAGIFYFISFSLLLEKWQRIGLKLHKDYLQNRNSIVTLNKVTLDSVVFGLVFNMHLVRSHTLLKIINLEFFWMTNNALIIIQMVIQIFHKQFDMLISLSILTICFSSRLYFLCFFCSYVNYVPALCFFFFLHWVELKVDLFDLAT